MNKLLNLILEAFGVCRVVGWQNIYRSGHYHRVGKPLMYDRHPGDLYPTREAAEADVDPPELLVATVKVVWYEAKQPHVNCGQSRPVSIADSRRQLKREPAGHYEDGVWVPPLSPEALREQAQLEAAKANALSMYWG